MSAYKQETLYRVEDPESHASAEYYALVVHFTQNSGMPRYWFAEYHGYWVDKDKNPVQNISTYSPDASEYSDTPDIPCERYELQRSHRAKDGFVYSFSVDFDSSDGYTVTKITAVQDDPEEQSRRCKHVR